MMEKNKRIKTKKAPKKKVKKGQQVKVGIEKNIPETPVTTSNKKNRKGNPSIKNK